MNKAGARVHRSSLNVNACVAVVAEPITHANEASLYRGIRQKAQQDSPCFLRILRKASLGEVQLVGSIDQLDGPVYVAFYIVIDLYPDTAAPQEFRGIRRTGHFTMTFFEQLVLLQA